MEPFLTSEVGVVDGKVEGAIGLTTPIKEAVVKGCSIRPTISKVGLILHLNKATLDIYIFLFHKLHCVFLPIFMQGLANPHVET